MEKKEAIKIIRKIEALGLETGSSGNVSFRADAECIYIKPTLLTYSEVNEENLSVVYIGDGKCVGGAQPSSDLECHLEIYRARKDVQAIVHSHSHFATVCAVLNVGIPVYSTMHADYFGCCIPCLPFINHRVGNFGSQILEAKCNAALLAHHGSLLLLEKPSDATKKLSALEEIARLYYDATTFASLKNIELSQINKRDAEKIHRYFSG